MSNYPPMKMTDPRFLERVKDVQRALGFTGADVDAKIGHNTLSRIEDLVFPGSPAVPPPAAVPPVPGVDARSAKNILTLLEPVRPQFERIVVEGTRIARSLGATDYIMIGGTRTYAEQDALYAQGRSKPGPIVTNVKGGYSNHNFGIAGDFGVFAGADYLDNTNPSLASRVHKAVGAWVKEIGRAHV